jgi:hypothetical protein
MSEAQEYDRPELLPDRPLRVGDRVVFYEALPWKQRKQTLRVCGVIRELEGEEALIVALPTASKGFGVKRYPVSKLRLLR